jgi:hypothetical protein
MTVRVMDLVSSTPDDLPPRYGSDRSTTAVARIVDLVEGGRQLIVSLYGGAGVQIPATAVNWEDVRTAHVLLDPDTGRPVHALGPAPSPEGPLPAVPKMPEPMPVARHAVLTPQWMGTWTTGGWSRYGDGGAWQGINPAGQRLRGLVTYGRQLEALGTITVTRALLTVRPASHVPPWALVIQPAAYSESGPQPTGATQTITVATAREQVDITDLAKTLTAGAGLALVGAAYGGITKGGASGSLHLDYTETLPVKPAERRAQ